MDEKQDYFNWLCEQVDIDRPDRSYWLLANELHSRTFSWIVERDENRAEDGLELRDEYLKENGSYFYYDAYDQLDRELGPCTVLEMLIGLAKRMDFEMSDPNVSENFTIREFWEMIHNLELDVYDDDHFVERHGMFAVDEVITRFLNREYEPDGRGGLFPLRNPGEDQRNLEIWYQMCRYLNEHS